MTTPARNPGGYSIGRSDCCIDPDCCNRLKFNPQWLPYVCLCVKFPKLHYVYDAESCCYFAQRYTYERGGSLPPFYYYALDDEDAEPVCLTLLQEMEPDQPPGEQRGQGRWNYYPDGITGPGAFAKCLGEGRWQVGMSNDWAPTTAPLCRGPGSPVSLGDYTSPVAGAIFSGDIDSACNYAPFYPIKIYIPGVWPTLRERVGLPCPFGTLTPRGQIPDGIEIIPWTNLTYPSAEALALGGTPHEFPFWVRLTTGACKHTGGGMMLPAPRVEDRPPITPQRLPPAAPVASPLPAGGPGTELKKLLAELGLHEKGGCGCNDFAAAMDRMGVAEARKQKPNIVARLKAQSKKANLFEKARAAVRALAAGADISDPYGWLVDEACRRAEAKGDDRT